MNRPIMFVFFTQKRKLYNFLFCFIVSFIFSQTKPNLVNNYSCEEINYCPSATGQIFNVNHLFNPILPSVKKWFSPNLTGSPDYFNICATNPTVSVPNNFCGIQFPRTGNGYIGGALYFNQIEARENIEISLSQTLQSGKIYCVTFYVSLSEISRFAISNIGAYFSNDSLKNYWPYFAPPYIFVPPDIENSSGNIITDTTNWTKIQGNYLAKGNENFMMLGNLRNDIATNKILTKSISAVPNFENASYYYFDDISVVEINPAKAALNKTITLCPSTTFTLGTDSTWDATYAWQPTIGLSCSNCPNPVVTITNNIKYYLTKQQCSSTTQDSVMLQIYTPTLTANAGLNKTLCFNQQTKLGTTDSTQFSQYIWLPNNFLNCTVCATPISNPSVSITYTLQKSECTFNTTSTVSIKVKDCETTYFAPNIFTPNNDNANETWSIRFNQTDSVNNFNLHIYNRWGTLIFEVNKPGAKWDGHTNSGEECSAGVYYYVASFDLKGEKKEFKGNITLLR